jgi:hypothetical protein
MGYCSSKNIRIIPALGWSELAARMPLISAEALVGTRLLPKCRLIGIDPLLTRWAFSRTDLLNAVQLMLDESFGLMSAVEVEPVSRSVDTDRLFI